MIIILAVANEVEHPTVSKVKHATTDEVKHVIAMG